MKDIFNIPNIQPLMVELQNINQTLEEIRKYCLNLEQENNNLKSEIIDLQKELIRLKQ
jgi:DNA repair exonuclease SbcCD ATPase subunit